MSPDEVFVLIITGVVAGVGWGRWYWRLLRGSRLGARGTGRLVLGLMPPACLSTLYLVLRTLASFDVRGSVPYLLFYLLFGAAWLAIGRGAFTPLGISWLDDALERRNGAAAVAVGGGLLGLMACYAGANIGDGPGWWCVLIAGALASAAWLLLWALLQCAASLAERITVDRDPATAWRLAGFLLATGLLCGRGAAGDWTSAPQTVREFAAAWPALPLLALAIAVETVAGQPVVPGRAYPLPRHAPGRLAQDGGRGVGVAALYVALALLALLLLPPPPDHPRYDPPAEAAESAP
jgi:uncharacterized membrane protein YjfL (UPF0719 family)